VLRFFKQIDATVPRGLAVDVVLDNLSALKPPEITKWLAHRDRRRWHLPHPNFEQLDDLIERWFKELTDRRLRRGVFTGLHQRRRTGRSDRALGQYWNNDPKPFVWKATAREPAIRRRGAYVLSHRLVVVGQPPFCGCCLWRSETCWHPMCVGATTITRTAAAAVRTRSPPLRAGSVVASPQTCSVSTAARTVSSPDCASAGWTRMTGHAASSSSNVFITGDDGMITETRRYNDVRSAAKAIR
jgi:hypothetical protein